MGVVSDVGVVSKVEVVPEGEVVPKVKVVPEAGEVTRTQTSPDETRKPDPPHDLAASGW